MGNKFKHRPQERMDQQAIFESRKREALSSLDKLKEAGDIKEAAVVFSQEGMKLFAEMFGNTMERKMEQAIDNKLKDVMSGFFEGMVHSYLEGIKPKIGLPAPEPEQTQEEETVQHEPLSVRIERETGITFNNEGVGEIDLSQDEEESDNERHDRMMAAMDPGPLANETKDFPDNGFTPENEEKGEEEEQGLAYGWTEGMDNELIEELKIAKYKGDKMSTVYRKLGDKWGKAPSAISARKYQLEKGEVTYVSDRASYGSKTRKGKVKTEKKNERKLWSLEEEKEILDIMIKGKKEIEAGNRGANSQMIREFAERTDRTWASAAKKGEKLLKAHEEGIPLVQKDDRRSWTDEQLEELYKSVEEAKAKGQVKSEVVQKLADKYGRTPAATDRRYYELKKEKESAPQEPSRNDEDDVFTPERDEELIEKVRQAKMKGRKVKKVFGELAPKWGISRSMVARRLEHLEKHVLGYRLNT